MSDVAMEMGRTFPRGVQASTAMRRTESWSSEVSWRKTGRRSVAMNDSDDDDGG